MLLSSKRFDIQAAKFSSGDRDPLLHHCVTVRCYGNLRDMDWDSDALHALADRRLRRELTTSDPILRQ